MNKLIITVMWIFGLGVITFEENLTNKFYFTYSAAIFCIHLFSAVFVIIHSSLNVNFYENTLIRGSVLIQYYVKIIHILVIMAMLWKNRLAIHDLHEDLKKLEELSQKYKKKIVVSKKVTIFSLLFVLFTAPLVLCFGFLFGNRKIDFFTMWSCYIPGISINVYVTYMCYLERRISGLFRVLNEYLDDFCSNISWKEKLYQKLDVKKSAGRVTMTPERLHDFFQLRNKIFTLTVRLNQHFNFEYLLYTFGALHGIILLIYMIILDLIRVTIQKGLTKREHFFTEYWTLIYIQGVISFVLATHELTDTGNQPAETLHKLRSICNDINKQASLYTFQLMFMEVKIKAAEFFEINYSTLMGILGILIKYTFILMQFDIGLEET